MKKVFCPNCNGKGYNVIITGDRNDYCGVTNRLCPDCDGTGMISVPMTNGERIRAMSDEELADFYVASLRCPPGKNVGRCEIVGVCKDCWFEWLKQAAEEE